MHILHPLNRAVGIYYPVVITLVSSFVFGLGIFCVLWCMTFLLFQKAFLGRKGKACIGCISLACTRLIEQQ